MMSKWETVYYDDGEVNYYKRVYLALGKRFNLYASVLEVYGVFYGEVQLQIGQHENMMFDMRCPETSIIEAAPKAKAACDRKARAILKTLKEVGDVIT